LLLVIFKKIQLTPKLHLAQNKKALRPYKQKK